MKELYIDVKNKIATYSTRGGAIVCGNNDYKIRFTFDEEWEEHDTKTARFIWNGEYYDKEFTGDECSIPVINDAINLTVGVYAGDLKTTTPANIPCLISILCGTPKIIDENVKDYRDKAQEAAAKAQEAAKEAVRAAENIENPTIDVKEIEGGHRVTIHDADGDKSFDVMDGTSGGGSAVTVDKVDPSKVIFGETVYTGYAVGNITLEKGKAILANKNENLLQVMKKIYSKTTYPTTTQPSVTLTFNQAGAYEVGTIITPSYTATFTKGLYSFDDDTGVKLTGWKVTDSVGNSKTTASGSFNTFTVTDKTNYTITAKATYTDGKVPHDNMGGEYPAGQIKAGTATAPSLRAVTGYRCSFYGTLTHKNTLDSDIIRGELSESTGALYNGSSFTISIPKGAVRVVIAYPATLRAITSVKDVNGLNAEISGSFKYQQISVGGANDYDPIKYHIYTLDYANANDTVNTYTVTI